MTSPRLPLYLIALVAVGASALSTLTYFEISTLRGECRNASSAITGALAAQGAELESLAREVRALRVSLDETHTVRGVSEVNHAAASRPTPESGQVGPTSRPPNSGVESGDDPEVFKLLAGVKNRYGTISRTEGTISVESVMSKEHPLEWLHSTKERDYQRAKEEVVKSLLREVATDGVAANSSPIQSSRLLIGDIVDAIVDLRQRMETVRRLRDMLETTAEGHDSTLVDTESRMSADAAALQRALEAEIARTPGK